MAVFIKKPWNQNPLVFAAGSAVRVSGSGKILTVVDGEGKNLARFHADTVEGFWVEESAAVAHPGA